MNFFLQYSLHL